jgi:hypothetical protein
MGTLCTDRREREGVRARAPTVLACLPSERRGFEAPHGPDRVLCNCQVIGEVHWVREVPWLPDTTNIVKHGPPRYVEIKIVPPSDPDLVWANIQLEVEGFQPVP